MEARAEVSEAVGALCVVCGEAVDGLQVLSGERDRGGAQFAL